MPSIKQDSGRSHSSRLARLWQGWSAGPSIAIPDRRIALCFVALGLCAALLALVAAPARAKTIIDSAGRSVDVPAKVTRVVAAGAPAAVLLYVLAPQVMIGWPHAPPSKAKPLLLASVRDLPELGPLTGRGQTPDLEQLVAAKPDLIIDFGTVNETYRSLAERVQSETGIPYLLIDGRLDNTPAALRLIGDVLEVKQRGETLAQAAEAALAQVDRVVQETPPAERPRIYLARGANGLETRPRGTLSTEIISRIGAIDVVDATPEGGPVSVTLKQLITWAPDTILTLNRDFRLRVSADPAWQPVPAVQAGRVLLAPDLPFGFIDMPPSVNRLIGLTWLSHQLYPGRAPGVLREQVRTFYRLFYQVELGGPELDRLLAGRDK